MFHSTGKQLCVFQREMYLSLLLLSLARTTTIHLHHTAPYVVAKEYPSTEYFNPQVDRIARKNIVYPAEYLSWAQLADLLLRQPSELHLYGNYITARCGLVDPVLPEIVYGSVFSFLCDLMHVDSTVFPYACQWKEHSPDRLTPLFTENSRVFAYNTQYNTLIQQGIETSTAWIGFSEEHLKTAVYHYFLLFPLRRQLQSSFNFEDTDTLKCLLELTLLMKTCRQTNHLGSITIEKEKKSQVIFPPLNNP